RPPAPGGTALRLAGAGGRRGPIPRYCTLSRRHVCARRRSGGRARAGSRLARRRAALRRTDTQRTSEPSHHDSRQRAGRRDDGRPIVGPEPEVRGLWYATGHGRNGVLLAALTGEIIVNLITTGASEIEIASLAPERFTS